MFIRPHHLCLVRRTPGRLAALLVAVAVCGGCDTREQKPRTAESWRVSVIGVAAAQEADRVVPPAAVSGAISRMDETFALYAASSGLAEIEGAQLVLKMTSRAEVRDYAQKLAREHAKAMDELRRIAAARGLKLPREPTGRHADMVTKLTGLTPADRDEAFLVRFGVEAHKETIALFERQASEGEDPELKRYARQMLPSLREHMAAAQKLIHAAGATR
jgi:putative membrane protein